MAKIRIQVQSEAGGDPWFEDYDRIGIGDNGNVYQAEDWAFQLIKNFNDTLRPGESPRKLIGTEVVGVSTLHHWVKLTAGMSVEFRGRIVDLFECSACGITGKRVRLNGNIQRDSKFRAKKYERCSLKRVVID